MPSPPESLRQRRRAGGVHEEFHRDITCGRRKLPLAERLVRVLELLPIDQAHKRHGDQ
ncbi:MAG: hypothetical protein HY557_02625 [Euryarchaeota archaeon]|nr:hypothetical protein [Euryarchaeota archaeon]